MPKCVRCEKSSIIPFGWGKYTKKDSEITINYCPDCQKIFNGMQIRWGAHLSMIVDDQWKRHLPKEESQQKLSLLLEMIQNDAKEKKFDYDVLISNPPVHLFLSLAKKW